MDSKASVIPDHESEEIRKFRRGSKRRAVQRMMLDLSYQESGFLARRVVEHRLLGIQQSNREHVRALVRVEELLSRWAMLPVRPS